VRVGRALPLAAAAVVALALVLAGCSGTGSHADAPSPTQTAWTEAPTGSPAPTPGATAFVSSGTAAQNQPVFDAAIRKALAKNAEADGNAVVAALRAAGFPMNATQVSQSTTSANLKPGSIMVGVKIGDACLVGQWGAAVDGYQSTVAPVLGSGGCLIGGIPVVG
jgi:hypothetical protein